MIKFRQLFFPGRGLALFSSVILLAVLAIGCASRAPERIRPTEPIVQPPPPITTGTETMDRREAERDGRLITFGKLRTVIISSEWVKLADGRLLAVNEIRPILESELVRRDFRIFSRKVEPDTPIAEITRKAAPHLVIRVRAESDFINTTGRFSRFRALADVEGIRGRDGTLLVSERLELDGPRDQDERRAGELALRDLAPELAGKIIDDLLAKSDQLLWAGLIVGNVETMEDAVDLRNALEAQPYVDYVEILDWDRKEDSVTFEILYGLEHESDIATLLNNVPGLRVKISSYEPGRMDILRQRMDNYK